ncbi:T9SS type A sorting domain-containing protein [Flavobacteriaceae bacterium]|nr:T9SS type A sorting domain-containing protein [Flavobacteriaceae bacterium]MDC3242386.1 T9SS type A sorting domain-containing protein [Flavobacteriaceae bacterium]
MKKITLLTFLFSAMFAFSQTYTATEDFTGLTTVEFQNDNGSTNSTVENASLSGSNAVASDGDYGQIITQAASQPWQAGYLVLQDNYMDLTTTRTIEVDVYSDTATFILAKAVGAVGGGTEGATDASHPGNGWATLEFDFDVPKDGAAASASQFEKLFFFPLWNGTGFDGSENNSAVTTTAYDNVKYTAGDTTDTCANGILDGDETDIDCGGSCATCPEPVVIELNGSESWESYINAFTLDDVYQFGFAPSGPESLKTEVVTDGVKFFPNFDVWDENDATPQNGNPAWNTDWFSAPSETSKKLEANLYITDNTLIGKDITFNGTIPENTLVNTYEVRVFIKTLNGGFADTGASDVKILTASETGTFSLNVSREASLGATYIQYGFAVYGECADPITEFVLGNVKFSSETLGVASNELNTFKVYPNPTLGDWTVKAQNTIQAIQVYDILGKEVFASRPNNTEAIISTDALRTGVYFAKVTSNNVEKTVKLIKQ